MGSSGAHGGHFSRDSLPVFSVGGHCEQFWNVQGRPLFVYTLPKEDNSVNQSADNLFLYSGKQPSNLETALLKRNVPVVLPFAVIVN